MSSGSHFTPNLSARSAASVPGEGKPAPSLGSNQNAALQREEDAASSASLVGSDDAQAQDAEAPDSSAAEGSSQSVWKRLLSPLAWVGTWYHPASDREDVHRWTRFPAVLSSVIVHTVLLLLLALWSVVGAVRSGRSKDFVMVTASDRADEPQVEMQLADGLAPPPPQTPANQSLEQPNVTSRPASSVLSELLSERAAVNAESQLRSEFEELLSATDIQLNAGFSSTGVEGRKPNRRREIALARGGTQQSEKAVEDALVWLAEHQQPSGAWSLVHSAGNCNGRCGNDGSNGRFDTAATGLSLLAFLGAGYTHLDGKHRDTVRRGVYFLLQVMEQTPQGGSFLYQSDRGMYNHGIAAFALCEAYQLTLDRDLKEAAQQAVDFIVSAQNYRGGWGYLPKQPGDLTLSGWQIMALKSAHAADLNIPSPTIMKIDDFLDTQQSPGGTFFGYRKPGKSPTCTAIGLLVRLFRGMPHSDPRVLDGAVYFRKTGPSNTDAYFNYYVTLFLFHVGGGLWEDWNPVMRDYLVKTQGQYGHEKGSWYFDNPYGKEGGRLYTTAMCAMTLEVYYRFSPLYQQADQTFEL